MVNSHTHEFLSTFFQKVFLKIHSLSEGGGRLLHKRTHFVSKQKLRSRPHVRACQIARHIVGPCGCPLPRRALLHAVGWYAGGETRLRPASPWAAACSGRSWQSLPWGGPTCSWRGEEARLGSDGVPSRRIAGPRAAGVGTPSASRSPDEESPVQQIISFLINVVLIC